MNILYIDRQGPEGKVGAYDHFKPDIEKLFSEYNPIVSSKPNGHIDLIVSELFGVTDMHRYLKKNSKIIHYDKIPFEIESIKVDEKAIKVNVELDKKIPILIYTRETRSESFFSELAPNDLGTLGYFFDFLGALKKTVNTQNYATSIKKRFNESNGNVMNQFSKGLSNSHFGLWGFDESEKLRDHFEKNSGLLPNMYATKGGGGPRWSGDSRGV